MKTRLSVFTLVVVLVASVSSCAKDEVAAGSGSVVVADESAASRQCRASVPSALGAADLEALVKTEFGSSYGSDGLFLTSFAAIGIRKTKGKFALWLQKDWDPKSGVGWDSSELKKIRTLLSDTGWTPCVLARGALAERGFNGEWINVQFVEAGGSQVALLFSNYLDEPIPRFATLDAAD